MIKDIAKEYMALIPNVFGSFKDLNKHAPKLSHMQNHVIEFMYMHQRSLNLKEICNELNIAKQQLSMIIKDLEMSDYVVKVPDPKDKRAVLVSLTNKGKETQEKKWIEAYRIFNEKLAKLNEQEQIDLEYALRKVNLLLQKMEE